MHIFYKGLRLNCICVLDRASYDDFNDLNSFIALKLIHTQTNYHECMERKKKPEEIPEEEVNRSFASLNFKIDTFVVHLGRLVHDSLLVAPIRGGYYYRGGHWSANCSQEKEVPPCYPCESGNQEYSNLSYIAKIHTWRFIQIIPPMLNPFITSLIKDRKMSQIWAMNFNNIQLVTQCLAKRILNMKSMDHILIVVVNVLASSNLHLQRGHSVIRVRLMRTPAQA